MTQVINPVQLPASKSQLSRLGERLAAGALEPGDRELYVAMLDAYDQVQGALVAELREIDWNIAAPERAWRDGKLREVEQPTAWPLLHIVGRTKTRDTLVQKLRRDPRTKLPYVRDIAGVRIVGDLTLVQQDTIALALIHTYGAGRLDRALIDRRKEPQAGYRALHVALNVASLPVEVQIRTRLQHLWAEVFERSADVFGRQIRYGEPPDNPAVQPVVEQLQDLSLTIIDPVERMRTFQSRDDQAGREADRMARHLEETLLNLVTVIDNELSAGSSPDTLDER